MIKYFLSEQYIDEIKVIEFDGWREKSIKKIGLISLIQGFLLENYLIYSNLSSERVEKIFAEVKFKSTTESGVDIIIYRAIKEGRFISSIESTDFGSQCIYLSKTNHNIPFQMGLVSSTTPIDFREKFVKWVGQNKIIKYVPNIDLYSGLFVPPASSLVVIDPYLFRDNKLNNFISFLKNFYIKNISTQFHLTLYSNLEKQRFPVVERFINSLNEFLKIDYEIILLNRIFTDNRSFISNYCIGSFDHPFDRDDEVKYSFTAGGNNAYNNDYETKQKIINLVNSCNYFDLNKNSVNDLERIFRKKTDFRNRLIIEYLND
jgi:hypothetical protein